MYSERVLEPLATSLCVGMSKRAPLGFAVGGKSFKRPFNDLRYDQVFIS